MEDEAKEQTKVKTKAEIKVGQINLNNQIKEVEMNQEGLYLTQMLFIGQ